MPLGQVCLFQWKSRLDRDLRRQYIARVETGWWLRIPLIREGKIADVLFHEIGHHIHFTCRPEYREKEDVADV